MRHRLERLAGTLIVLLVAGCAGIGTSIGGDHVRWTEEVKLSDGRVIQIQRHVELTESGFPVQKRGFSKYHEICYPPMGIQWKSRGGYQPDIFDIVDGKAYMHVPISDCFSCERFGYPESNAVYFAWESGKWRQIRQEEFPTKSEWNLEMGIKGAAGHKEDDMHGLVTIERKEQSSSSLRYEQKRLGWKRVSDSYSWKNSCHECKGVKNFMYGTDKGLIEVLIDDTQNTCRP